ncbi:hypothetical protein STCU_08028 [Strigomonas culicis]|nr:hypothetical protein STCU_08028 [Strigomonas culicis]|eukprot:EPY22931.1 hypothetical protein STCU_08028 [Strigomonas culicis]
MTEEEYLQAISLFTFFTEGGSAVLSRPQLARLIRWLNYAHTPKAIEALCASMDADGDGYVSKEDYLTWRSRHRPNPRSLCGLSQVAYNEVMVQFHLSDKDEDGWLRCSDVCAFLLRAKRVRTVEEAEQCFGAMDLDGNGLVGLNEFLQYCAQEARQKPQCQGRSHTLSFSTSRRRLTDADRINDT